MLAVTVDVSPLIVVFDLACFLGVIWTAVDMAKQPALSRRQKRCGCRASSSAFS